MQTPARWYPNKDTITKTIVCSSQSNQLWSWLGTLKYNNIIIRSASMQWWFWFWYSWNSLQRPPWRQKKVSTFTNVSALNLTGNLCSEFYDHDWLQTCRYKTRVLWRLFAEVREKSVLWFWNYWHFLQKWGLNICRYLKRFYTCKKINSIFFKFDHSLLRMPKIIEIG